MDRRLVLTNEAARHPFRRGLPPVSQALLAEIASAAARRSGDADWKLFVLSFTAFFISLTTFIA
ncbi:hypothetical protein [Sphingomonas sp.]|jgi:hypothetical protein|uniref:hypothetical protein n=1 Tax=Sphingomonas sp. TaxID=28214 RepID=UPI0035C80E8F